MSSGEALALRDKYGRTVRTGLTQDGELFVSIVDGVCSVMAVFSDERFAELRELLDRAAMPGREAGRG